MANKPAGYQITPADIARCGHIVAFLRREMDKREWGPPDLAKALGLKPGTTTIYPWINGTSAPSPKMRVKLAKLLGVEETALMARDPSGAPIANPTSVRGAQAKPQPVGKMLDQLSQLPRTASGTAWTAPKQADVLAFTVTNDGRARIKLDTTLPLDEGAALLRVLLDMNLMLTKPEA